MGLWIDFVASEEKHHRRHRGNKKTPHPDTVRASNARRAKRAVEAGQYRKAIQALTSGGLAPPSAEIVDEMLAKHPQSPLPPTPSSPAPPPGIVLEAQVAKALRSFPSDSAPGPSMLRANHLKEAVFCPSADRGNKALRAITTTINHLSDGHTHPPHLCGANLLASRACMVEEVRARIPSLAAWVESCYGSQLILHFGDQQGDPIGPLLFALMLHPIVERIKREVPNLNINVWYLDDGTLCGDPEDLLRALKIVE